MADQPFQDRHVVVTGGTGALGIAVVGALLAAGASSYVPYINPTEASRFPHREHPRVKLVADVDLSDDSSVMRLYAGVPKLWASIHLAGGFAYAPIGETSPADLRRQIDMNFTTCFLCCRAAVAAVAALTIALAEEVAAKDILVNAIAPSILDTPANRQAMPKADHATWPKVEEVARTILFLASPDNKVTRGAIVPVYGKA